MAHGATARSPRTASCAFPCSRISSPRDAVAQTYGAYRSQDGVCERALFVIDSGGTIRWSYLSPIGVNPGADGILAALEDLASKPGR
jgi:peroxiredoxin